MVKVKTELKNVRKDMSATTKSSGGLIQSVKGLLPAFGFAAIIAGLVSIGKKAFTLAQQTISYRQTISKVTGLQGKELADTTAGIEATSKTFKKEVGELITVNNTLAKTFKISQQEATNLINKGFLDGADASGEFISMLKEYPVQFKAAGLSAEQSIALMSQSVKEGIYSDKGADVIKEGTLRLREMTKATREALDGVGISSIQLEADLKKGTITYFDAIQKVSNKLGELPPQSAKVGTALADIFGGAGEDAGLEYIKMLGTVDKNLQTVNESVSDSERAQQKLLESNQRLTVAWSNFLGTDTGMFTSIKAGLNDMLSGTLGLIDIIIKYRGVIVPAVAAVTSYAVATKLLTLWQNRSNKATLAQIVSQKAYKLWTNAAYAATQLFAAAQMLLAGNTKGAAQAMRQGC